MRVLYPFDRCIICLNQPCGGWEHVLPEFIGGRLQGRLLCSACNNNLGSSLVSKLKFDPSIRLAMEALKDRLPALYANAQKEATFIGNASDGSLIRASATRKGLKILPSRGTNTSLILDTNEAAKTLRTKLIRYGISPDEAAMWKSRFLELQEGVPLQIPTGEIFLKQPTPPLRPELGQSHIDDRLFALIAFEFLSLLIGKLIFRPSFDPIRKYILRGFDAEIVTVEHFAAGREYGTFHAMTVSADEGAIQIDIRLFRWIAIVVTFRGFDYRGPDSVYFEDLLTPRSLIAHTRADATQGNWYTPK
jgi:hypothetical protein